MWKVEQIVLVQSKAISFRFAEYRTPSDSAWCSIAVEVHGAIELVLEVQSSDAWCEELH